MLPGIGQVEFVYIRKSGEWYEAQVAINGQLCPPVSCHASALDTWTEEQFKRYLVAQSESMLTIYGDARQKNHLNPEFATQQFAFA